MPSTHRERKELYLKDLELRLNQSQASIEELSLQKNQISQEKQALEAHTKAVESENRHLKQLLEANNIPVLRASPANSQPTPIGDGSSQYNNVPLASDYVPQKSMPEHYGNNTPSYKNTAMSYSAPGNVPLATYNPSAQSSMTDPQIPAYSANGSSSRNNPNAISAEGVSQNETSSSLPVAALNQRFIHPAFKDPHDPKFVDFIVE